MTGRGAGYHVAPCRWRAGWSVRRTGAPRALMVFPSAREAWNAAKRRAKAEGVVAYRHDAAGNVTRKVDFTSKPPS